MRLAFSTNAYTRYPVEEAVRRIAALGYRGVEVLADVPHAYPPHTTRADVDRLRGALDAAGVRASNVNAFTLFGLGDTYHPSYIDPDPARRRARIEHTRAAMHLARALGAPSVSVEPGGPLPEGMARVQAEALFRGALQELGALGERLHVDVLVEPEPGLLLETSEQFLRFMDQVQSPRVGLNFDVGHFYAAGEDPAALVPALAPWTRHYQVEDIAATREHRHLVPGRGAIDLRRVLDAIERTGHRGFVTVELYPYTEDPDAAAAEALEHLRSLRHAPLLAP